MIKAKTIKLVGYDSKYATAVVTMWRASKENALGRVENHSFDDHLYYLNEVLAKDNTICLAVFEDNETVAGLMATDGVFLNQLYIHTECQREGVGSRLLDLAKTLSSGKLQLYTFEMNSGAQNFFEKHGFKMAGRGSDNEEQLPDILYEWCKVGSNAT